MLHLFQQDGVGQKSRANVLLRHGSEETPIFPQNDRLHKMKTQNWIFCMLLMNSRLELDSSAVICSEGSVNGRKEIIGHDFNIFNTCFKPQTVVTALQLFASGGIKLKAIINSSPEVCHKADLHKFVCESLLEAIIFIETAHL